jgi:rRNA maturation RNase YbeY
MQREMRRRVSVIAAEDSSEHLVKIIANAADKLLRMTNRRKGHVEIYLVGNRAMTTNVLAFPAPKDFPRPDVRGEHLGEIYLNPRYVREHGEELSAMLVHGYLHLLLYDHKTRNDRIKMEGKEAELLSKIPNF